MSACSNGEIEIYRGANDPAVVWEIEVEDGVPADLSGLTFELEIEIRAVPNAPLRGPSEAETICHTSGQAGGGALTVEPLAGRVTWFYSIDESLRISRSRGTAYTLFRVNPEGKRRPIVGGPVNVRSFPT